MIALFVTRIISVPLASFHVIYGICVSEYFFPFSQVVLSFLFLLFFNLNCCRLGFLLSCIFSLAICFSSLVLLYLQWPEGQLFVFTTRRLQTIKEAEDVCLSFASHKKIPLC